MFLASKIVWAGIAFTLLTTGVPLQNFPRSAARSGSNNEGVTAFVLKNEVKKMQDTLRNKGLYQGMVDGVLGLRTRASLSAYQKAENLPVTGQVDVWTADRLGVRPESTWITSENAGRDIRNGSGRTDGETKRDKPSAGIRWAEGRTSKTSRGKISRVTAVAGNRADGVNRQ